MRTRLTEPSLSPHCRNKGTRERGCEEQGNEVDQLIHASSPTRRNPRPVDNATVTATHARHAWMALTGIGGGLS